MTSGDSSECGSLVQDEDEPVLDGLEGQEGQEGSCMPDRVRLLGLAFTVMAGVLTILIQDTAAVIGLVGAACGIPISYVLPPLIYLNLQLQEPPDRRDWAHMALCGAILVLGLATATTCVANTAIAGS